METTVVPQHLLLLSPPGDSSSHEALYSQYGAAFSSVLTQLAAATRNATLGASLDIALPLPLLYTCKDEARSRLYKHVQPIVAGIYKLICVISAKRQINVEDSEGIDVRIVLLAVPKTEDNAQDSSSDATLGQETSLGPVVSLQTLAQCQRQWRSVFAVEGQEGDQLLRGFLVSQDDHVNVRRVPGGSPADAAAKIELSNEEASQHSSIAVGGTWDHIHIGHKLLLTMFAFMLQSQGNAVGSLTVGITGDELLKNKKYAEVLESWHDRQRFVIRFLRAIIDFRPPNESNIASKERNGEGPNSHAIHYSLTDDFVIKLVEISDPFGPTITDQSISALVLSAETRSGGKAVNEKREAQGWQPLEVLEVDVLDTEEDGSEKEGDAAFASKLSSTDIRKNIVEKGKTRTMT